MKAIYLISLLLLISNAQKNEQDANAGLIHLSAKGRANIRVEIFNGITWYPEPNDYIAITDLHIRGDSNAQHFQLQCIFDCEPGMHISIQFYENQEPWQEGPPLALAYMVVIVG